MTMKSSTTRLGDIVEIVKGRKPRLSRVESADSLPYLVAKVMRGTAVPEYAAVGDRNSVRVDETDTIIICDGSNSGEAFSGFRGVLASTMGKLVKKREIDDAFLRMFLELKVGVLKSGKVGAAIPHLDQEAMANLQIRVPPLGDQQRIVAILDETFAGIDTAKANAEKNLQNASAVAESYLEGIFTMRGVGWVDRQLSTLCREITVGHVGPMKSEYVPEGVPFLRSQNIRPFEISLNGLVYIRKEFHKALGKSRLQPGDLAIVRTGYPGTAAVIPDNLPDANCSDLVVVRPGKEVDPHFLAAFFNSAFGKRMVLGKLVGAAQKHFNVTAAKEVMLHVPPIPEQRGIVKKVAALREQVWQLGSIYERKLAALDELKQSLLHQAFTGQL